MTESLGADRLRELVSEIRALVSERRQAEASLAADFSARKLAAQKQYDEAQKESAARYERDRAQTESDYLELRSEIIAKFQSDQSEAKEHYDAACAAIAARSEEAELEAKQRMQDAQWQASAVFEAAEKSLAARLKEAQTRLGELERQLQALHQEAEQVLREWGHGEGAEEPPRPSLWSDPDAAQRCADAMASARKQLQALRSRKGPGVFAALSARLRRGQSPPPDPAPAALRQTIAQAAHWWRTAWEAVHADAQRQSAALAAELGAEMNRAAEEFSRVSAELKIQRQEARKEAEQAFMASRSAIASRHNSERRALEERYAQCLRELEERYAAESAKLQRGYVQTVNEWDARFHQAWDAMAERWLAGIEAFHDEVERIAAGCRQLFPDWNAPAWNDWTPPAVLPPFVPFGQLDLVLHQFEGGMPRDPRLAPPHVRFLLPACLAFRDHGLIVWKARDEGRDKAIENIRAIMLRMLTSLPPGKVRFLIVDPVGLGENFSAFMHLADFNEQLVSNRIWTESGHIERRLGELTEHMENIIQVYLRNEFAALQEYNASAGELAEPYRVLVVANFPAGFTETAARRLLSIVSSGARCGVYTLLSRDAALPLPHNFQLADLERQAIRLSWQDGRFVWDDADFRDLPLLLDQPPPPERLTEIVRRVGAASRDAGRVELPFEWVVPPADQWWTADSRRGIEAPLGRAGVTKLQSLQLGKGTAQHVLVAGKTGSGKSTLLHVLVMNLALRYSPDEVELYLVDFKKGVEFKAYAEAKLPHARIIAIESEREFGLSVLERLDQELRHRGDLFRERGVQDLPAYRAAEPDARMPRILLVVDEFQELFVEDDRIAQNAQLLLDRLVRQGRAFGIHVLLGSQTLAGAYSIPRATIGQMAVRIALQCSEADAHLILSEENTAARLLSRPGEAIYNDANGLYEGNHPFQVVWLSDRQREEYLGRLRDWVERRNYRAPPAIVFEGNQPANPADNPALGELIASPAWDAPRLSSRAWLGEPVAIREPTAAVFARQGGANLMIVGHHEETALGILAAAMIGLAAQHAPFASEGGPGATFHVLDGTKPDSAHRGLWARLAAVVPHAVRIASPREASAAIHEIARELARREQASEEFAPPIYLIVYDVSRFRDLRKREDDYGFSRYDEEAPPDPGREFRKILREGPALGIHVLLWADSYNSATRTLDRQAMDDIDLRVLFRMNAADSSSLIDSPAASQLGVWRAIFDDRGEGLSQKFRPYGPPNDAWLDWVQTCLCGARVPSPGAGPGAAHKDLTEKPPSPTDV